MSTSLRWGHSVLFTMFTVGPFVLCMGWLGLDPLAHEVEASIEWEEKEVSPWSSTPRMPPEESTTATPLPAAEEPHAIELALWSSRGLVLAYDVPTSWAQDAWLVDDGEPDSSARRPADPDRLPSSWSELHGSTVDLYGAQGKVCTATLGAMQVVAERLGDIGGPWQDLPSENASEAFRARIFEQEPRWLVATVTPVSGTCEGVVFGRSAHLPAPILWTRDPAELARTAIPAAVRSAFSRDAAKELRKRYEGYVHAIEEGSGLLETPSTWEEFYSAQLDIRVFVNGAGRPTAAQLWVGDSWASCGAGFHGSWTRMVGLQGASVADVPVAPLMFVDSKGNGAMQIIEETDGGFELFAGDGTWLESSARPYHGCPC